MVLFICVEDKSNKVIALSQKDGEIARNYLNMQQLINFDKPQCNGNVWNGFDKIIQEYSNVDEV